MNDFMVADISVHLAASKNARYRETVMALFTALASFLDENSLTVRSLLRPGEVPTPGFKIMRSDLTDTGYELIKTSFHPWLKGITTGKWSTSDTSILAKDLKTLKAEMK